MQWFGHVWLDCVHTLTPTPPESLSEASCIDVLNVILYMLRDNPQVMQALSWITPILVTLNVLVWWQPPVLWLVSWTRPLPSPALDVLHHQLIQCWGREWSGSGDYVVTWCPPSHPCCISTIRTLDIFIMVQRFILVVGLLGEIYGWVEWRSWQHWAGKGSETWRELSWQGSHPPSECIWVYM